MDLRHALALSLMLSAAAASLPAAAQDPVSLARDYVRQWQLSLAAVVAEETYTQTLRRSNALRDEELSGPAMRTLVSDVLLVKVPSDDAWLMFRDVLSVDGEPVRDRQQRFDALFVRPDADLVASARRIADESARYNLGTLFRNLNTPATTLTFLDDKYRSSVTWRKPRRIVRDGADSLELGFEQRRPPYTVRSVTGKPVAASGRIWIEAGSGRVSATELILRLQKSPTKMRLVCEFGPVPGIPAWVPLRMTEEYRTEDVDERQSRMHEEFNGQAVYSKHRVFQTDARIVGPR